MSERSKNPLPHDVSAEKALIGACLVNNDHFEAARSIVSASSFYSKRSAAVWRAMEHLADSGSVLDVVTVPSQLESTDELERVGGHSYVASLLDGVPRSSNALHYARQVKSTFLRRELIRGAARLAEGARNGHSDAELSVLLTNLANGGLAQETGWTRSSLSGVEHAQTGTVRYAVDGFLPVGELTLLAAAWKSGKTLVAYRLALDLVRGARAFGSLPIPSPVPVCIFQLEMPTSEDERRLRRLAIGAGMYPSEVPGYVQAGQLALYNRPDGFSLTTAEGVARFHAAVKASGARLVIVDSLLAAFGGADLNDNSAVRKLVSAAFLPLTSRDVAVLALHHRRKGSGGSKTPESERDAVLGAQAFGAAAGRVYSLERLDAAADRQGAFKLRLSLVGSWSPEDARDIVLQVADTEDGGTIVRQLDDAEQLRQGGIDEAQRAALRVTQLVRLRTRMAQKDALDEVATDLGCTRRTVEKGLAQAKARGWVSSVQVRGRALDLVPGSTAEEE